MKVKLKDYIKELENKKEFKKEEVEDLLTWISFFQHERLVHLIVTFFTGVSLILFLIAAVAFNSISFILLFVVSLCLFIPYILHYYYLENGVQRLYDIYFEAEKKLHK